MGTRLGVAFYRNVGLAVLLTGSLSIVTFPITKKFHNGRVHTLATTTQNKDKKAKGKKDPPGPPIMHEKTTTAGGYHEYSSKREILLRTAYYEFQGIEVRTGLRLSESEKDLLTDKFINDADGSPYFWTALNEYVAEAKLKLRSTRSTKDISEKPVEYESSKRATGDETQSSKETSKNKEVPTKKSTITLSRVPTKSPDAKENETVAPAPDMSSQISLVSFLAGKWGDVILGSDPLGAEVWLMKKRLANEEEVIVNRREPEGETIVNRRYPEGIYTFALKKYGYKSSTVEVEVSRGNPFKRVVVLESQ